MSTAAEKHRRAQNARILKSHNMGNSAEDIRRKNVKTKSKLAELKLISNEITELLSGKEMTYGIGKLQEIVKVNENTTDKYVVSDEKSTPEDTKGGYLDE